MRTRAAFAALVLAAAVAVGFVVAWRSLDAPRVDSQSDLPARADDPLPAAPLELAAGDAPSARALEAPTTTPTERVAAARIDVTLRGRVVASDGAAIRGALLEIPRVGTVAAAGSKRDVGSSGEPAALRKLAIGSRDVGSSREPFASARSADDGTFVFELAAPEAARITRVDLAGRRAGYAPFARRVDVPDGEAVVELGDLVLATGTTLRGSVRDLDGLAVAEAEVTATRVSSVVADVATGSESASRGRTLADGSFALVDAPDGHLDVRARLDDGRRTLEPTAIDVPAGGTRDGIELVVPRWADPTAILGIVLGVDGKPAAGAIVSSTFRTADGSGGGSGGRPADERGRFRIQGREGMVYGLTAADPRGEAVSAHEADVAVGRHDVVLRLTAPQTALLRVRGARGDPVERYAARVRFQDDMFTRYEWTTALATHHRGEVPVVVPGTTFFVEVSAPGHASADFGPFDPRSLPAAIEAPLELLPALRGRVVRRGESVEGAEVRAHRSLEPERSVTKEGFAVLVRPNEFIPGTTTDDDGTFELDVGAAGEWWLSLLPGGRFAGPYAVRAGGAASEIVLDVGPRGGIAGTVRTASGQALAGRTVRASCGDGTWVETTTDASGGYAFERVLQPGPWQVRLLDPRAPSSDTHYVRLDRMPRIVWDCEVADGATARFDVTVPDVARVVVRIVATAPGSANVDWHVRAIRNDASLGAEPVEAVAGEQAGQHALDLPARQKWTIRALGVVAGVSIGFARDLEVPDGTSEQTWTVADGAVRGRVNAPFTAESRVRMSAITPDGTQIHAAAKVAADGSFEFPFTIPGRFELALDTSRVRRVTVDVTAGVAVDVGAL